MAVSRLCSIEGCGKPHKARGWCSGHWTRWSQYGHPLAGDTPKGEPQRFFDEVVLPCRDEACLRWPYGTKETGYGVMRHEGRLRIVSRLACAAIHGPPPTPSHEAAHLCGKGNEGCVNPRHLEWKTSKQNSADMVLHGTTNRGERCGNAKLTVADVLEIRSLATVKRRVIAAKFGVTIDTVSDIRARTSWAWLE